MGEIQQFNTKLSYFSNQYVGLMEKDLEERGMKFDDYSKECVINAVGAIYTMAHESGYDLSEINGSNLKFIMQKVASLKLNANAQPRECYFQIRNVNVAPKGEPKQWEKKIEFNIEGDGNDALVQRYGVNVEEVYPCWKVREGDKYVPPKHKGVEVTAPEWEETGIGKVIRVVCPIRYKDGHIEYHSCERNDVVRNLSAHIKQNLQNETFGICSNIYKATDKQKEEINKKKHEIMTKIKEIGNIDEILECEELKPYISPSYLELQSRESMIVRKMRNNIMKSIPKKWDNPVQAYEYNMLEGSYREVQEEIEENANQKEFEPDQLEEKEQPKTVDDVMQREKVKEKVQAKKHEDGIPDFMSVEE